MHRLRTEIVRDCTLLEFNLMVVVNSNVLLSSTVLKKLTQNRKRWFRSRARNEARRRIRRRARVTSFHGQGVGRQYHAMPIEIWQGGEFEQAICTRPPTDPPQLLCFSDNPDKTTGFFSQVRTGFFDGFKRGSRGFLHKKTCNSTPRIAGYIDFSKLEYISIGAALVMTADYERLKIITGDVPPAVDLRTWNKTVLTTLYQLGFFNILGHLPPIEDRLIANGPTLTMKIASAKNADDLAVIDSSLQSLVDFLVGDEPEKRDILNSAMVSVLTTISEAITNVTQHAYPNDHQYEFEHVNRFWVSATAENNNHQLTVVIYDQGATIPVTYPRLSRSKKIQRFLRRAIRLSREFDYQDDGTYIRAALRFGGSRTDKPHRGKGFPQMQKLLENLGEGNLNVRSRGGWCNRGPNGRIYSGASRESLGGTLVEWTVDLSSILGLERL